MQPTKARITGSQDRPLLQVCDFVKVKFEGEEFIVGRTDEVVDTDWQGIIISLRHSGNMTNRNEMTEEPNGWHFGKIEDKLFLFLTSFDES
jgi:hypothetical protein